METPHTNTQEVKNDDEILAEAKETARQVGAVAERAVVTVDRNGIVLLPKEHDDVLVRRSLDVK